MKRLLVGVLLLLIGVSSASAQQAGEFTIGGRLGALVGFHELSSDFLDIPGRTVKSKINFNFSVYGAYTFIDGLSLQAELNVMAKMGIEVSGSYFDYGGSYSFSETGTVSTVDIPVLLKYAFINDPVQFGLLGGAHLSIPIGKIEFSSESYSSEIDSDGTAFGLDVGLFGGLPVGSGRVIGDVRFLYDLSPIKAKESGTSIDIVTRRGLAVTVGYELSF